MANRLRSMVQNKPLYNARRTTSWGDKCSRGISSRKSARNNVEEFVTVCAVVVNVMTQIALVDLEAVLDAMRLGSVSIHVELTSVRVCYL